MHTYYNALVNHLIPHRRRGTRRGIQERPDEWHASVTLLTARTLLRNAGGVDAEVGHLPPVGVDVLPPCADCGLKLLTCCHSPVIHLADSFRDPLDRRGRGTHSGHAVQNFLGSLGECVTHPRRSDDLAIARSPLSFQREILGGRTISVMAFSA